MTFAADESAGRPALGCQLGHHHRRQSAARRIRGHASARRTNSGKAEKEFKIISGDTLSLTPSMGWNTWYAYYDHVSDKLLCEAADVLVKKGMADVGYQYVSIDDCWANTKNNPDPKLRRPVRAMPRATFCPTSIFPT